MDENMLKAAESVLALMGINFMKPWGWFCAYYDTDKKGLCKDTPAAVFITSKQFYLNPGETKAAACVCQRHLSEKNVILSSGWTRLL